MHLRWFSSFGCRVQDSDMKQPDSEDIFEDALPELPEQPMKEPEEKEFEIREFNTKDSGVNKTHFDLIKVLGQGSFGKVFLVRKNRGADVGTFYAMKVLKKASLKLRDRARTKAERDILAEISHPFIVKLKYAFQTEGKVYLILDFLRGGDLFSRLAKQVMFTEADVKVYLAELVLALDHLHSLGIIYRDLKPENILLDDEGHIALTDFGLSKEYHEEEGKAFSFCGTVEYMAPEVVSRKGHDITADWWSFGVLVFEMLTGTLPFHADNRKTTMQLILTGKLSMPKFLSPEAQSLFRGLFRRHPENRLGFHGVEDIKKHPFFASIDWELLFARKVPPPFKPQLASIDDDRYFDPSFTSMTPTDSPAPPLSTTGEDVFRGFSYIAPSLQLSQFSSEPKGPSLGAQNKTTGIHADYFITDEVLGKGSFSICKRAIHRATHRSVCVKIVDKAAKLPKEEIEILRRYSHPHMVALLEVYEEPKVFYLVFEECAGGELFDYLQRHAVSEQDVAAIFKNVVSVVAYLHAHEVVHRDLKASNILFADKSHKASSVRLIDFGFAKQLTAENGLLMTPLYTAQYVAPEILRRQGYDKSCDVWALGVLLFSMLSGMVPFPIKPEDPPHVLLGQIDKATVEFKGSVWSSISADAKQLIQQLLSPNPASRPSASDVLSSAWLAHIEALPMTSLPRPRVTKEVKDSIDAAVNAVNQNTQPIALAPVNKSSLLAKRRHSKSNPMILPKLVEEKLSSS